MDMVEELEDTAPASRAIRRLLEDESTSAGGERPKVTVHDGERLWLAKMQDRGDVPHLPAKEFVVMDLAREAGLSVPQIQLLGDEKRKVYLIERFDRGATHSNPRECTTRARTRFLVWMDQVITITRVALIW